MVRSKKLYNHGSATFWACLDLSRAEGQIDLQIYKIRY